MSQILNIPTINDDLKDFDKLFQLLEQLNEDCSEVIIDFSKCFFLRQNAVAFLGGLIRIIKSRSIQLNINWDSIHKDIKMNLEQNGFMYVFCENKEPWQGNSIPYREDPKQDKDGLVDYLAEKWLGRDWVDTSQKL